MLWLDGKYGWVYVSKYINWVPSGHFFQPCCLFWVNWLWFDIGIANPWSEDDDDDSVA